MTDVTQILAQIEQGDSQAAEQLLPLVYDELRRLAAAKLAHENPGQTLQATALVHEAYLRLVGSSPHALRSPLVTRRGEERAGLRRAQPSRVRAPAGTAATTFSPPRPRRCGEFWLTPLAAKPQSSTAANRIARRSTTREIATAAPPDEVLAVHEALDRLTLRRTPSPPSWSSCTTLADFRSKRRPTSLGISRATAYRRWTYARTWLRAALQEDPY